MKLLRQLLFYFLFNFGELFQSDRVQKVETNLDKIIVISLFAAWISWVGTASWRSVGWSTAASWGHTSTGGEESLSKYFLNFVRIFFSVNMAGVVVWTSWLQRTIQTAQHIHGLQERSEDPCLSSSLTILFQMEDFERDWCWRFGRSVLWGDQGSVSWGVFLQTRGQVHVQVTIQVTVIEDRKGQILQNCKIFIRC